MCLYVIAILSHKSLICMDDCNHRMHGYSRHSVINHILSMDKWYHMKCIEKHVNKKMKRKVILDHVVLS